MYKIKQTPEDFIVKEIIGITPQNSGKYAYFLLKKRNYTTIEAIRLITKRLGIPTGYVGFAGSKDRMAVTEQLISIKNCNIRNLELRDIELKYFGKGNKPISLGDLVVNQFEIVVRNICKQPEKIASFVNYFGEQRFSKNNIEVGRLLIKKKFKAAAGLIIRNETNQRYKEYLKKYPHDFIGLLRMIPKKILQMYVHAFQSCIWNETVRLYLIKPSKCLIKPSKNVKKIPVVGFGTEFRDSKTKSIVKKILKKENIGLRDFIIKEIPELSSDGNEREIFAAIKYLKISDAGKDELNPGKCKVRLTFTLDKGCYATEAVKSLFKDS